MIYAFMTSYTQGHAFNIKKEWYTDILITGLTDCSIPPMDFLIIVNVSIIVMISHPIMITDVCC